jgi:tRNA (Thr-GGU) A37 N-methylase
MLRVHPRDDERAPLRGVFSTRSQDRPNPVGVHRVRITEIESPLRIRVTALEAFDGTPIIDLKPVLDPRKER